MYVSYWNLREEPFRNVADMRFAYLSEQHREGLARLLFIVRGARLGGVLVGPYGVGKSMVLEMLTQQLQKEHNIAFMRCEAMPGGALVLSRQVLTHIGEPAKPTTLADAVLALQEYVQSHRRTFKPTVITIDEAHLLRQQDAFDLIHLLTNLRVQADGSVERSAFTIILAGHSQLATELQQQPALGQRLQLVWRLAPLSDTQTMEYIQHRMRVAGGDIWTFEEAALREVHRISAGLPRVINNICDMALMLGFAARIPKVTRELIEHAAHDMGSLPEPDNTPKAVEEKP